MMLPTIIRMLDGFVHHIVSAAKWLAVPLVLLLFAQWPLRDIVKGWSREANDLGQCAFALFVAVSITAATRANAHLATDMMAARYSGHTRARLARYAAPLAVMPWALFALVAGWPITLRSVSGLEQFPDTYNPGYFLIKAGMSLMALLILAEALRTMLAGIAGKTEGKRTP